MKTIFNDGSPLHQKALGAIILFSLAFITLNVIGGKIAFAFAAPETKLEQLRDDACDRLREKEEACHNGDGCEKLTESAKWFSDKFNASPAECFAINSEFLTFGADQE